MVATTKAPDMIQLAYRTIGTDTSEKVHRTFADTVLGRAQMQNFLREQAFASGRDADGLPKGITVTDQSMSKAARAAAESALGALQLGHIDRKEFTDELWKETKSEDPAASRMNFELDSARIDRMYQDAINEKAKGQIESIKRVIERGGKAPIIKISLVLDEGLLHELGQMIKDPTLKAMGKGLDVRITTHNEKEKFHILSSFGDEFATKDTLEPRKMALRQIRREENEQNLEHKYQSNFRYYNPTTWFRSWKLPWNTNKLYSQDPTTQHQSFTFLEKHFPSVKRIIADLKASPSVESVVFGSVPQMLASLNDLYALSKNDTFKQLKFQLDKSVLVALGIGVGVEPGKTYLVRNQGAFIESLQKRKVIPTVGVVDYQDAEKAQRLRKQHNGQLRRSPERDERAVNRWVSRMRRQGLDEA